MSEYIRPIKALGEVVLPDLAGVCRHLHCTTLRRHDLLQQIGCKCTDWENRPILLDNQAG